MDGYCTASLGGQASYNQLKGSHGFSISSLINPPQLGGNPGDYTSYNYHLPNNPLAGTGNDGSTPCYDKYYDRTTTYGYPHRSMGQINHHQTGDLIPNLPTDQHMFNPGIVGNNPTANTDMGINSYPTINKLDSMTSQDSRDSSDVFSDPADCDKDMEGDHVMLHKQTLHTGMYTKTFFYSKMPIISTKKS